MSIIKVAVNDQILSFVNMPTISAGDAGIDSVKFDFKDSVWDGYGITCVFFKDKNAYYPIVLDTDNVAKIPMPILQNKGTIHFGLSATKDENRLTSTILAYTIEDGVFYSGDEYDDVLTKTVYEEILENYESIKEEQGKIQESIGELKSANEAQGQKIDILNSTFTMDISRLETAVDALKSADSDFTTNINTLKSSIDLLTISMTNNDTLLQENIDEVTLALKELTFNVKYYGAVGDGKHNEVKAIKSAISACSNAGGGTVYFPNGTYWFGEQIIFGYSNIKIQGSTNTIFTAEPPNNNTTLRNSEFFKFGTSGATAYNGFSNIEINNIIFDLGGKWSIDNNNVLTYKAKYDSRANSSASDVNSHFLSYCPIRADHGDGLKIKNCTFKNGIYAGYTGSPNKQDGTNAKVWSTNPHIFDIQGVKNILIEGCVFDTVLTTSTSIINWVARADKETGQSDVNYSEFIQLDAVYGDGSTPQGEYDGTNCRDIIIRNNKFYGLPYFDWKTVKNNTVDAKDGVTKIGDGLFYGTNDAGVSVNYSEFRFAKYAAIGTCHKIDKFGTISPLELQPENVEIYNNYFEHSWSSHYCNANAYYASTTDADKDSNGRYYPNVSDKYEPARQLCHGAIYVYPGGKNYNIHNNTFRETVNYTLNKSTAVFLYGSEAGIVHDNTFINYGEPLPIGIKKNESFDKFSYFSASDILSSFKKGDSYDGYRYCCSSNNLWIKKTNDSDESVVIDVMDRIP